MTKRVHLLLQGKGGVGKSYIASLLAQYHLDKEAPLVCFDADPVNATFQSYSAFNARRVTFMERRALNERGFDEMVKDILNEDAHFVVDGGAASFVPLFNYLLEHDVIRTLREAKKDVVVHTVVTGNHAFVETLHGLDELCTQLPSETEIVVWLNEFFGLIESEGRHFERMAVYLDHRARITSLVTIPEQASDPFRTNVALMLKKKLTFKEAIRSEEFDLMAKQRLTMVKREIFNQLATVI
jgi:hypothetical protein